MLVLRILFDTTTPFAMRLFEIAWAFVVHYLGSWALCISFILLFMLFSIPSVALFGSNVFGHSFESTMDYIPNIVSANDFFAGNWLKKFYFINLIAWKTFLHFNWYYKTSIIFASFFPFAHFVLGFHSAGDFEDE